MRARSSEAARRRAAVGRAAADADDSVRRRAFFGARRHGVARKSNVQGRQLGAGGSDERFFVVR
eukprot:5150791-Prymnesium_polylepis.1